MNGPPPPAGFPRKLHPLHSSTLGLRMAALTEAHASTQHGPRHALPALSPAQRPRRAVARRHAAVPTPAGHALPAAQLPAAAGHGRAGRAEPRRSGGFHGPAAGLWRPAGRTGRRYERLKLGGHGVGQADVGGS